MHYISAAHVKLYIAHIILYTFKNVYSLAESSNLHHPEDGFKTKLKQNGYKFNIQTSID